MEQDRLRRIAEGYLCPLLSGAVLGEAIPSGPRDLRVARRGPRSFVFKVSTTDDYRLILRRGEPFGPTARRMVQSFVDVLQEIEPGLSTVYEADVLRTLQEKVLAHTVADDGMSDSMLSAIDWLESWADRSYEGRSVAAALGFDPRVEGSGLTLEELRELECGAVLSNGVDTLVLLDSRGHVVGHECLDAPAALPPFAPYFQAALTAWAVGGRTALALTPEGEILMFKDNQLLFAKRSGRWHFLAHRPLVTRMPVPSSDAVRKAIYESCLDASFASRGACVGVVMKARAGAWEEVVMHGDRLDCRETLKTRVLGLLIGGRTFPELDRRFRLELLSLDGALVLDHRGKVLAVGAILRIPGGSTGGGRLAAARVLASLGLGIKVSQDGSILCFHRDDHRPIFSLM